MKLWRAFPSDPAAESHAFGGSMWFAREFQGAGRHDNPELYGCLYVSEDPVSAIAEQLAPFRGSGELVDSMLVRTGLPVSLVSLDLPDPARLVDLDDPVTLEAERLRPSQVATGRREVTQSQVAGIFQSHPESAGIRWWSTLESGWINVTLFDRCAGKLEPGPTETLSTRHPLVAQAADFLGL